MKFRTEIEVAPWELKIDHRRRGFSVGSCFAERIAEWLRRAKFPIETNPTGVLYNPFSIADALEKGDIESFRQADYVLITFGTAWVYELDGKVVANCERRPANLFTRRRLGVEEIVERFSALLEDKQPTGTGVLAGKQVIFTLSPVRHLKDGFEENSLSKAVLRVAIGELVERYENAIYFPAYEIFNDDLRDYRFYGADLAHPSTEAVGYVWEKFSTAAFDEATRRLIGEVENIARAIRHRPFNPDTQEHNQFRKSMLKQIRELAARHPELDLSDEIKFFD